MKQKKVKAHTRQTAPTNKEIAELLDLPLWQFYDYLRDRKTRPAIINRDMTIEEMHVAVNHYKEYGYKRGKPYIGVEADADINSLSLEELETRLVYISIDLSKTLEVLMNKLQAIRETLSTFKI